MKTEKTGPLEHDIRRVIILLFFTDDDNGDSARYFKEY